MSSTPPELIKPSPTGGPPLDWEHRALYDNVRKTLHALPEEFKTSLRITDFRATDLFTLNSALGASIEDAVVTGLNRLRKTWDPDGKYAIYRFERQAQSFPDVRLITDAEDQTRVLMGIELKGWFALSKEGEPTFRYAVTPAACAPADLLVVYPWVLSDVVAGSPKLMTPFITEARYAAELRNWYWETSRTKANKNGKIELAQYQHPYPSLKSDQCSDRPADDGGGNFGRVARYGLLTDFVAKTVAQDISGIRVEAWLTFLRLFNDSSSDADDVVSAVSGAITRFASPNDAQQTRMAEAFEQIGQALRTVPPVVVPAGRPTRKKKVGTGVTSADGTGDSADGSVVDTPPA